MRRTGIVVLAVSVAALVLGMCAPAPASGATSGAGAPPAEATRCAGLQPQAPGNVTRGFGHHGYPRTYTTHVPPGYDPTQRTPVVLLLHGQGAFGLIQLLYTAYDRLADREGFLVVAPDTAYPLWNQWQIDPPPDGQAPVDPEVDDTGFLSALLDRIEARYCVDPGRVFATGHSSGAFMAGYLACRLPDRIAAVVTVAGTIDYEQPECAASHPVPVLAFHGTADHNVPFDDQTFGRLGPHDGVVANLRRWATGRNGCAATSTVARVAADVSTRTWDCPAGQTVRLVRIQGGGHTWPGAAIDGVSLGPTTRSVSATTMGWRFFVRHPLA